MRKAQTEGLNIGYYLTLVSRRRWFIIVPFCLAVIVGMALVFKLPKIYEASTMILVQPQRVPEKMVASVVDSDIENRISTLSQQIMSRSNLERVIDQFKLFSDPNSAQHADGGQARKPSQADQGGGGPCRQGEEGARTRFPSSSGTPTRRPPCGWPTGWPRFSSTKTSSRARAWPSAPATFWSPSSRPCASAWRNRSSC